MNKEDGIVYNRAGGKECDKEIWLCHQEWQLLFSQHEQEGRKTGRRYGTYG